MLLFFWKYFMSHKTKTQVNFTAFSSLLETRPRFPSPINIFSINDVKEKLHANVPEMFNLTPRTSIWKYPIFCSWYNLFNANISDFYRYFIAKNQIFWAFISLQNIRLYWRILIMNFTCFAILHNRFKYEKNLEAFFSHFFLFFVVDFRTFVKLRSSYFYSCPKKTEMLKRPIEIILPKYYTFINDTSRGCIYILSL